MAKFKGRLSAISLLNKMVNGLFDVKVLVVLAGSIGIFVSTCNHSATVKKTDEIVAVDSTTNKKSNIFRARSDSNFAVVNKKQDYIIAQNDSLLTGKKRIR